MSIDPPDPADRPADLAAAGGESAPGEAKAGQAAAAAADGLSAGEPSAGEPSTGGQSVGGQSVGGLAVIVGLAFIAVIVSAMIWFIAGHQVSPGGAIAALAAPQLLEIEQLLDRLGFPPGEIDGVFDRDTAKAIEAYQQAAGLAVDGQPGLALLDELREVAGTAKP